MKLSKLIIGIMTASALMFSMNVSAKPKTIADLCKKKAGDDQEKYQKCYAKEMKKAADAEANLTGGNFLQDDVDEQ